MTAYLSAHPGRVVASFVEIESGKRNDRPELAKALAACKLKGATLIVASWTGWPAMPASYSL